MEKNEKPAVSFRKQQIVEHFLIKLDQHLADLKEGRVEMSYGIKQLADLLFLDPNHLSDTVRKVLGKSPCTIFEEKLVAICKDLIVQSDTPISTIAYTFSYEPSNFTKLFKRYTGTTPLRFRNEYYSKVVR